MSKLKTFKINGITYIGKLSDAEMDYENRDEWYYKMSFQEWCNEYLEIHHIEEPVIID